MDWKRVLAIDREPRPFASVVIPLVLCVSISFAGCHSAQTQAQNESKPAVEVQPKDNQLKKSNAKFPPCPGKTAGGSKDHKVTLTWNASVTPNQSKEIRYCLYRSKGRVQRIKGQLTVDKAPCSNCELVTPTPIRATSTYDLQISNDASYCYVAVAIEDGGRQFSEFSNQAEADVPKAGVPGSNQPSSGTLCDTSKAKRKRR